MHIRFFIFSLCCGFFTLLIGANNISVYSFALSDQLPSTTVFRIYQDSDGFLWFGSVNGLCRFDAYNLLIFRSDMNNPNLLTNNHISCISEDKNGNLLIGTKKGLNILNKNDYSIITPENDLLLDQEIKTINVTNDGNIWIGAGNHIYCLNPDFSLRKQYDNHLPTTGVNQFYEDKNGNFWILLWEGGLHKYVKEEDRFIRMPSVGGMNNPFRLFQDNRNQYWLCTWGDGVFLFDPQGAPDQMYHLVPVLNKENHFRESVFFNIIQDGINEYVWLMSRSGLYAFGYSDDNRLTEIDISSVFKESNNIYSDIVNDKTGNLWIATYDEGVLCIDFKKPEIQNYIFSSIKEETGITANIVTLYKDKDGDVWFYQDRRGLAIYNPEKDKVTFYQNIPVLQNQNGFEVINYISGFRSMPETIWVASDNKKKIFSIRKDKGGVLSYESVFSEKTSSLMGIPYFFYEDRSNNIWIVASNGLFIKTTGENETEEINHPFGIITGITEDNTGNIWISTKNAGVFIIPASFSLPISELSMQRMTKESGKLMSNNIEAINADSYGNIWMGTHEGHVISYRIARDEVKDVSASINMSGEKILAILDDKYGHVWIMTDRNLIEYNPETGASRGYTTADGIQVTSFREKSCYKDEFSGKLYFGGNKGISVLSASESLIQKQIEINTLITNVKINNRSVFRMEKKGKFNFKNQTLILEPNDKNIEIDFSSLNYSFAPIIRYAYKMEGIDDHWIYTNNRQYAIYNKIGKGKKKFYVKATDENNLWSSVASEFLIYKKPAFYETWWAYLSYLLFFVLFLYLIYRWMRRRINLKNELKIVQIEKKISEELTQTKLRYFTNITHDFLTPLTILSCLVDDAETTFRGNTNLFDSMRSNINKLIRLLQQILDFRKIEEDKIELRITSGDIVKFIRDICYTNFTPLMKKKNIDFCFVAIPDKIIAFFDANIIDKIVYNLLSNACKYTPDNGTIKVETEEIKEEDHTRLKIKIKDSGTGIEAENIPHIFTRFYNNSRNITRETNGIGLSLTKELTDIHKGHISVQSELGKGSVFTVEIPIDEASYKGAEIIPPKQSVTDMQNTGFQPVPEKINVIENERETVDEKIPNNQTTILIVEDNEELLILIRNLLSHHYQVLTAENGMDALSVVKEYEIDIIISDVMMAEMDGLELCRNIKKNLETSHIPVILLTAKNSVDDRVECYNAGADGYISKPFDLKILEARIKNFMANKKNSQKEFKEDENINLTKLKYQTLDEKFLNQAVSLIEENLSEIDFDVISFAEALFMSKSSLYRKLKSITGLSPVEFIRNIRLKEACRKLKEKSVSISEVAYSVGFSDPKYFATCFKNEFNISPSEYQKKSHRDM